MRALKLRRLSLDLHFSSILDLSREECHGIIVLRHPRLNVRGMVLLARQVVDALEENDPSAQLWNAEPSFVVLLGITWGLLKRRKTRTSKFVRGTHERVGEAG